MEFCFTANLDSTSSALFSSLLLLGTVHSDTQGFRKATAFFNLYEPDLIFTEISPFARLFRQKHQRSFHKELHRNLRKAASECGITFRDSLKHPEIIAISRQLSLPFEYRAARAYARRRKVGVLLVDYSAFSKTWISSWPGLTTTENLRTLLAVTSHRPSTDQAYRMAERRIRGGGLKQFAGRIGNLGHIDRLWERRECFMAKRIKLALSSLMPRRPLYIGGWWHLTEGGSIPTLREILAVDIARCRLLDSAVR